MKKVLLLWGLVLFAWSVQAHVGSSGVVLQGKAGEYRILVNIQPPDVIPGTANVTVYVENGGATRVQARPIYFRSGDEGAPTYDMLEAVPGQLGQFQGIVWLMEGGSSSVQLVLEGAKGKGEFVVPVVAVSTAERDMPAGLGWMLTALGLLLLVLLVTVIGASVSDGVLRAGQSLTTPQKRKRYRNMGIALVACLLILYGGGSWWDSWAATYKRYLYKSLDAHGSVVDRDGQRLFQFKIDTTDFNSKRGSGYLSYLVPDHGKLMHLFLVRTPGLDAFAHLHPERTDSTTYQSYLPNLPPGKYLVYGDIFSYSGFTETLTDTIDIPELASNHTEIKKTDPEDTYVVTDPLNKPKQVPLDENVVVCGQPGTRTTLQDDSYVVWEGKANQVFEAGKPLSLNFAVFTPESKPAILQPYLGMAGHAAVVRSDGSVYVHLHPIGTVPMAAELSLKNRIADTARVFKRADSKIFRDSIDRHVAMLKQMPEAERESYLMQEMGMDLGADSTAHAGMEHGSVVSFPYAFPKAGQYRIFLQIKRNGRVLTGVFDARVTDPVL
ncbi:hypothetical protein [Salmonirosea aquatica]|uniref:Uncharacterized protein n=1 Tax=Salmonirosea aquatica TaxID=2654236 RepID=A0A7C9F294_9BACT|nr:hypothetical protein [Cytophagaceae bacterium SJW1-29]